MIPHTPGHWNAAYVPAEHPATWCNACHRIAVQPKQHQCGGQR